MICDVTIYISSLMSFVLVLSRIWSISVIELSVILVGNVMVGIKLCVIIELKNVVVESCILILSLSMFRSPHRTHRTPSPDNKAQFGIHFWDKFRNIISGARMSVNNTYYNFFTIQLTYLIPDIFNLHVFYSVNFKIGSFWNIICTINKQAYTSK